jgi:GNAT superfamily N-acetyltransferase
MNDAGFTVRRAAPEDAAAYARTHVQTLGETYAHIMPAQFHRDYEARLDELTAKHARRLEAENRDSGTGTSWIALDEAGTVVGFAAAGPQRDVAWQQGVPDSSIKLELHHLYTLLRTHGTGLGQQLLDATIDDAPAFLWILNDNLRAERFYRRNGFVPDGYSLHCGPSWYHKPMFRMHRGAEA